MPARPRANPSRLTLLLSTPEIKALEARAAGEARSISNLIEWVITGELARGKRRTRKARDRYVSMSLRHSIVEFNVDPPLWMAG